MNQLMQDCGNKLMLALSGVVLAILLAGCAQKLLISSDPAMSLSDYPAAYYQQARAAGMKVLRINSARSLLTIAVRRSGPLAKLGHDHVVASHNIQGEIAPDAGRADMLVTLADLTVDEPALLEQAGFRSPAAPGVAEATRQNMLDKVLDVLHFPHALIQVSRDAPDSPNLKVDITLHRITRSFVVPAKIVSVDGKLSVTGEMQFKQTEFGITPLSVLGGRLQVEDELTLRFQILAEE